MPTKKSRYTRPEHDLARRLFASDQAKGTLKRPMAIAVSVANGVRRAVSAAETTYQQYLPDARRILRRGE